MEPNFIWYDLDHPEPDTSYGEAELVEGNTWNDTFWGVSSMPGKGKNWLGRLLMQVRDDARPCP